ncbi:MAG: RraA family protein [Clostridium sp.]|nr:RraA family protein [Clostridium sp.]
MERLTKEQIAELEKYDTPTVCNALETFQCRSRVEGYMRPGMILRTPAGKPMVGYAATAKVGGRFPREDAREKLMEYYSHVREMGDPTVAVIQDNDKESAAAFWGEVQATVHMSLGCVGTIMDGGVRDIKEAGELGFQFFSTEIAVAHGYTHVEEVGVPVSILGLDIYPGDLIHGDCHGVAVIPHEAAPRLAQACEKIAHAELPMLEPCRQAIKEGRKPAIEELSEWRTAMEKARSAT